MSLLQDDKEKLIGKQKELDKFKKFDELENENKNLKVNLENFLVDKTTKN